MIKNSDKKELVKLLNENADYTSTLETIKDEEERRKIKAFTEDVFVNFFTGLKNVVAVLQKKNDMDNKSSESISKK